MYPQPPTGTEEEGWGVDDDLLFPELEQIDGLFYCDAPASGEKSPLDDVLHGTATGEMFDWESFQLADEGELLNKMEEVDPVECIPTKALKLFTCNNGDATSSSSSDPKNILDGYGINDTQLSDMSLKHLKALCKNNKDYDDLKTYRRTCQNRYYARSSRSKQQIKTSSLAKQLTESEQEITRLQRENEMKDVTIRCLQLELQLLRSGAAAETVSH